MALAPAASPTRATRAPTLAQGAPSAPSRRSPAPSGQGVALSAARAAEAPHALASLVCLSGGLVNGHNAGAHAAQGVARPAQTSPRATRFDFEQNA